MFNIFIVPLAGCFMIDAFLFAGTKLCIESLSYSFMMSSVSTQAYIMKVNADYKVFHSTKVSGVIIEVQGA